MKKETLADKMAKKAFLSDDFQKSWAVHMQAFGPILGPAFEGDYQSRVHLTAALNKLSRKDLQGGLEKLKLLQDKCETNADKAAFLFFVGLCMELAGDQVQMLAFYQLAGDYNHRFYLPYMKQAKFYESGFLYERAEENYRKAIGCFTGTGLSMQDRRILGSAYTSLAACLTMMHRYEEAEDSLSASRQLWPEAPGRSAAEAVLYAALGQQEKMNESLRVLEGHAPEAYPSTRDLCGRILDGTEAMFCAVDVEEEKLEGFWNWFLENASFMEARLEDEDDDGLSEAIGEQLNAAFPFGEKELETRILLEEDSFRVLLPDYFAVGLTRGYERLLEMRPEELPERWKFEIVRYTK